MTTPTDDKFLDEYLSGKSRLSAQYRDMDAEEVPSHLDERILAQARAAIPAPVDEVSRLREKRRRLMRWSIPTAIAASALLVVSIVIRSGTQHELQPTQVRAEAPEAPAMAKPDVANEAGNEVVLIAPPRNAVSESSPFAPPPVVAERIQQRRELAQTQARSVAASAEMARQALHDAPPAIVAPQPVPALPAAPPPPAMEEQRFAARQRQAEGEERQVVAEATIAQAAAKQSIARSEQELAMRSPSAGAAAPFATPASADATTVNREDPTAWLEYIRQLRRDGEKDSADREWKAFLEKYPEHPVAETDLARGEPAP